MDKLKMHSPNLTQDNIAKIRELFPGCVTEAKDKNGQINLAVDFDQLRQELSDAIVEGPQERYHLNWPGKREALLAANAPIAKTLRPCREESVDFDTTKNLFIEGDNLDALKLLQEIYLGGVKLIYIDPPYNTGKEFIYDDDFADDVNDYMAKSNQSDESNLRLVANTEANGRFHSDWLSMMYPRLKLAKNLLKEDGAVLISIDDHELQNLRHVMDEIFGAKNFIATIIWHKMDSPKNSARHLSEDHDYIILYAKNADSWKPNLIPRSDEMVARYKNPDNDPRGPWLLSDLAARNPYSAGIYPITTPSGKIIEGPPAGSYWRISKVKFDELDKDNRIWWGESGDNRPGIKRFLSEVRDGVIPQTYWHWKEVGSTRNAKQELSQLMGAKPGDLVFDTPKPTKLLSRILQICTNTNDNDIVLDFFAGSGTTADAVMRKNIEDRGNRRYIQVQISEAVDSEKYKTIADFNRERLLCSGDKLKAEVPQKHLIDVGFRYLRVDTSSMENTYYSPDDTLQADMLDVINNIKPDRTNEDLLFQVLVDWGVDLTLPIGRETLQGREVFFVNEQPYDLIACFDTKITEDLVKELAGHQPLRVVFRDTGFASDAVKINVEQIFRQLSPRTDVKTI